MKTIKKLSDFQNENQLVISQLDKLNIIGGRTIEITNESHATECQDGSLGGDSETWVYNDSNGMRVPIGSTSDWNG